MEEFMNFGQYQNPELVEDYRKAAEAHKKSVADFDKAAAVFLKFQDADSRKILEQILDNIQNAKRIKTELAVKLADNLIDPAAWRSCSNIGERRRKAMLAAEAIKDQVKFMKWSDHDMGCELKA